MLKIALMIGIAVVLCLIAYLQARSEDRNEINRGKNHH